MVIGAAPRSSATTMRPRLVSIATGTRFSARARRRRAQTVCAAPAADARRACRRRGMRVLHGAHSKALMNIARGVGLFPSEGDALIGRRHARHGDDKSSRAAGRLARFPRADQAAGDEPGGVLGAVRNARRARTFRRSYSASPRSCASRSPPGRAARSTNGTRSTSTRRCGGPPSGRCRPAGWTVRGRSISASGWAASRCC